MATATMKTPPSMAREIDALREKTEQAAADREAAHARVAEIERTVQRCRRIADPNIGAMAEGPVPTLEEVLTARSQMVRAEQARADAQLAALHADRKWATAGAELRAAQQAELHAKKSAAIAKLVPLLLACRPVVDAVAQIEEEEDNLLGPQYMKERFAMAWNGLKTPSPIFEPTLETWLRAARAQGLLREEESA
jgi:hypothetical protein